MAGIPARRGTRAGNFHVPTAGVGGSDPAVSGTTGASGRCQVFTRSIPVVRGLQMLCRDGEGHISE